MIMETQRLILRQMSMSDFDDLCKILQDSEVMYAYEHAFEKDEVTRWLVKQLNNYETFGFGLWAVVLKESGEMIGQCGLTMQAVGETEVLEIGYLFRKEFWHHGYALEAAKATKNYAFQTLDKSEVYSIIRDNNLPSQNVAIRNGMKICGQFTKHYYGMDMLHYVFKTKKIIGRGI